ncbi:MAG: galactose-1-phosphate uridylyltransferase, partial [Clostridia bacterium]|nr:galactose-1-phosphate uridylyltransferase [Clostridia bacterium]
AKHAQWADAIVAKYGKLTVENADAILKKEVGIVFAKVLEHAGVYARNEDGKNAFLRFVDAVNNQ